MSIYYVIGSDVKQSFHTFKVQGLDKFIHMLINNTL